MLRQAYSAQFPLITGTEVVNFSTGLEQGDPSAPLCFALATDECIRPISHEINIWYLDDGVLVGAPETIATELDTLKRKLLEIGPQTNTAKREFTFLGERGSVYNSSVTLLLKSNGSSPILKKLIRVSSRCMALPYLKAASKML